LYLRQSTLSCSVETFIYSFLLMVFR